MCGRFTQSYTWRELYELYRLTCQRSGLEVIQAPKPGPRIMRYELTDFEWAANRLRKLNAAQKEKSRRVAPQAAPK